MENTYSNIEHQTFEMVFESGSSLVKFTGVWGTFTDSTWACSNGHEYEEEFTAIEFFINGVYDENDNQLFNYPNLDGQIHDLLMEHENES